MPMPNSQQLGILILRGMVALTMVIHGVTRVKLGGVAGFGEFLAGNHVPFGIAVAWALTLAEIAGGLALALGFAVVWLCAWFVVELALGIALVHFKEGWFVVGAGRNGMEYSVLLIVCFVSIALTHWRR